MPHSIFKHSYKNQAFLTLLWGMVQISILFFFGINTEGEAHRFIQEANHLINHQAFSSPVYFMYLIEILLVFIKIKFSLSYQFIIAIQLVLNLSAVMVFYRFAHQLYQSEKISLISASILILCIPYQFFNSYIYTESIFFSLSIIYSCQLLSVKQFTVKKIFIILTGLLILCITRPTGIFFAGATFIWYFFKVAQSIPSVKKLVVFLAGSVVFLIIINNIVRDGQGVNVLTPFKEEHVICDVPTIIRQSDFHSGDDNSISGLFIYILRHPKQFIRLGFLKSIAFFGLNRTYFSLSHNLFTDSYFYSLYLLIIGGIIFCSKRELKHFRFYLSLIFIFWISVVFSCDEWNNRFFLTLTPFLILMALPLISKKILRNKGLL